MVRTFIVILLLAVFFLAGTLYGMDHDKRIVSDNTTEYVEQPSTEEIPVETETVVVSDMKTGNIIEMENQEQFVPKVASFLEGAVTGFYEIVVEILYQIAQIFF